MGGCATKPGDLKAEGEAPLAVEAENTAPDGEKNEGLLMTAEADPADESRRRSLGVLFKENAEGSDQPQEAEKIVTVESIISSTIAAVAETNQEVGVQPENVAEERTIEELKPEIVQEDDDTAKAVVMEEEKPVNSDTVQELAAGTEEKKVDDDASVPASAPSAV